LVWAGGNVDQFMNNERSLQIEQLMPFLLIDQIHWVVLQKEVDQKDWLRITQLNKKISIQRMDHLIDDFYDTASIIKNLDLVITVDTSVAHLAGSMNCPTWVMSRKNSCWRWFDNQEDTPWYPEMRLFFQHTVGQWDDVVNAIKSKLISYMMDC
jgi:hypothetical protein